MRFRTIRIIRYDDDGVPHKIRDQATWIGPMMLRYVAHIFGLGVFGAEEWRAFMSENDGSAAK